MIPRGKKSCSKSRHFQADMTSSGGVVPGGVEDEMPYHGLLDTMFYQMFGDLYRSMFYAGAHSIAKILEHGRLIRITDTGLCGSCPHDIVMITEAPNYFDSHNG